MPFTEARHPSEKDAVGTEKAAIRPGHEYAENENDAASEEHPIAVAEPVKPHERIITTDKEAGTGGDPYGRKAQVNVSSQPQGSVEGGGNANRGDGDEFLDSAERTNRGAESAPKE